SITRRVNATKRNSASRYDARATVKTLYSGCVCGSPQEGPMAEDTLARMFWTRVEEGGGARPAQQFKRGDAWVTVTAHELGNTVRELALGLITLGRQRGDRVALLSASRAEWVQADFAIFSIGGVTVPVYPSYPPDLVAYVVNDSEART